MRTSLCLSLMSYGGSYDFFRPFDKEIVSSECKKLNGRIYVNLKPRTYDCRACYIRIIVEGHFEKTIEERMTLVKGGLMTERSRNIASDTGVMGTSELYLPRVYWALVRSKVEGIVSF